MSAPSAASFSRCFLFRWCRWIHAVEVAFESIHVSGPEPAEGRQPGIHLQKRFWLQPVETALCVHRGFHETSLAQHAQVLGHGRLRHTQLTLDLSHRLLGRNQKAQDRAAVRLRNDFEDRLHSPYILSMVYTCQGIYKRSEGPSGRVQSACGRGADWQVWRHVEMPASQKCVTVLTLRLAAKWASCNGL